MHASSAQPSPSGSLKTVAVGKNPVWTAIRALLWVGLILIVVRFLLLPIRIGGDTMEPTLKSGSFHFINRMAYKGKGPSKGDLVAFHAEAGSKAMSIARVIALPGQNYSVKEGKIHIDGTPLQDKFSHLPIDPPDKEEVKLPPKTYLGIGDNRSTSGFSEIVATSIVGKLAF